uniref:Uncharacterized protein n=1 Tax=Lotharella globosa TaxID=91324 RepID=A0A7S3YK64_9EUKA
MRPHPRIPSGGAFASAGLALWIPLFGGRMDFKIVRLRWSSVWRPWGYSNATMEAKDNPAPWKRRYVIAEKDATRHSLTKDELVCYVWRFHFTAQVPDDDGTFNYQYVRFVATRDRKGRNDSKGFLHMEQGYPPLRYWYPYSFVCFNHPVSSSLRFRSLEERKLHGKSIKVIIVEHFPAHTMTRRPGEILLSRDVSCCHSPTECADWRWEINNM